MPDENLLVIRNIHVPRTCTKCSGTDIEYKGVGEYVCRDCKNVMYDDFGLVRNYLEEHRGATQSQVAAETGVSMETIRQFLRDERIEIMSDSNVFMYCELCRTPIRSGRYCVACASKIAKKEAAEKAAAHKSTMQGSGKTLRGEDGARRFKR